MSDLNDDVLNYELGELGDEDDLLLSDEDAEPTKLTQQDEALLLDDDEDDLLTFPESTASVLLAASQPTTATVVAQPVSSAPSTIRPQTPPPSAQSAPSIAGPNTHSHETRDDSVTTTTPESHTSKSNTSSTVIHNPTARTIKPIVFELTPSPNKTPTSPQSFDSSPQTTPKLNRTTLKRATTPLSAQSSPPPSLLPSHQTQSQSSLSTNSSGSSHNASESKKLRIDAPEFVPKSSQSSLNQQSDNDTASTSTQSSTQPLTQQNNHDVTAVAAEASAVVVPDTMSYVSTSSEYVDLQNEDTDDIGASQSTLDEAQALEETATLPQPQRRRRSPVQRRRRDSTSTPAPAIADDGDAATDDQAMSTPPTAPQEAVTKLLTKSVSSSSMVETTTTDGSDTEPMRLDAGHGAEKRRGGAVVPTDMETDDGSDDGYERLNPKHRVERDRGDSQPESSGQNVATHQQQSHQQQFYRNQRGGGGRGGYSSVGPQRNNHHQQQQQQQRYPYGTGQQQQQPGGNENYNPQYPGNRGGGSGGPSLLMNPHTAGAMCVGGPPLLQYSGGMTAHVQQHPPSLAPGFRPMYNNGGIGGPGMGGMAGPGGPVSGPMAGGPGPGGPPMHMHGHRPPYHPQQQQQQQQQMLAHQTRPGGQFPPFNGHGSVGPMRHQQQGGPPPGMGPRFNVHHHHRPPPPAGPHMMVGGNGPIGPYGMQQRLPYRPPMMGAGVGSGVGLMLVGPLPPQQQQQQMGAGLVGVGGTMVGGLAPPTMPRKVLINPNFKGGVQAATNQLMLDTMKGSSPYNMPPINATSRHDDELLRQQEAFINQNRMHIEKRRHERSPEHDHRDRSYSPPANSLSTSSRRDRRPYSRERDTVARKPVASGGSGGGAGAPYARRDDAGRGRRAGSRDAQQHGITGNSSTASKRRKSTSVERPELSSTTRVEKQHEPEDDETRAYRLEIEKQKLQREQILKDKEMRRRKAAEDLKNTAAVSAGEGSDSNNKNAAIATKPLTTGTAVSDNHKKSPIVLKKMPPSDGVGGGRTNIPTAKVFPESKRPTTAVVKPVVKQQQPSAPPAAAKTMPTTAADKKHHQQHHIAYDMDEDELLANSPSTSPTRMAVQPTATTPTARFTNRRVVLKTRSSDAKSTQSAGAASAAAATFAQVKETGSTHRIGSNKGIFDRLDRKVTTVNVVSDAAKRKIQRIVVQNTE